MSRPQREVLTGRLMALAVAAARQGRQAMADLLTDAAEEIEWLAAKWERRKPIRPFVRGDMDVLSAAKTLGAMGGRIGGVVRAAKLSPERRREIAQKAAQQRWKRQPDADAVDPHVGESTK